MWLLADIVKTGMLLAGIALMILVLLRRTYKYYGRRKSARRGTEPHLAATERPAQERRSLTTAPPDVLRWHVEMHETARDMKAELDSKMRVLQLLIAQARQEAERLEQLLSRLEARSAHDVDSAPTEDDESRDMTA